MFKLMNKTSVEDFLKKAHEKYGNYFNYDKVIYKGTETKVIITCPIHGDFEQTPYCHLKTKFGCPKCGAEKQEQTKRRYNTQDIIELAKEVHGEKYDYSKTKYINNRTPFIITCPVHGDFIKTSKSHINQKQGCPKCTKHEVRRQKTEENFTNFIKESKKRFGDIYEFPYIEDEYVNSHSKITIKCKKCGNIFTKIVCDHLTSQYGGCLYCYVNTSKSEMDIADFIESISDTKLYKNDRNILGGREIDIYLPDLSIGIEYNGVFWHTEEKKGKYFHLEKTEDCKKKGVKLIHIFEDEYKERKDVVLNKIKHLIKKDYNLLKIAGRKCDIKEITQYIALDFLEKYHIQGFVSSTLYYGAFYNDELIAVMTFKKLGKGHEDEWELTRFTSNYNYICQGIGGKLFKHFIKENNPILVKSFADRRWTINEDSNVYIKLGFNFEGYTRPDYKYLAKSNCKREHKFKFRKKILLKKYPDLLNENMTEREMTEKLGYSRIYDCGLIKYVWKKDFENKK